MYFRDNNKMLNKIKRKSGICFYIAIAVLCLNKSKNTEEFTSSDMKKIV